jgi:hypothetical protein
MCILSDKVQSAEIKIKTQEKKRKDYINKLFIGTFSITIIFFSHKFKLKFESQICELK